MVHPDLRAGFGFMSVLTFFFKRPWFTRLMDGLGRRMTSGKPIEGLDCDEVCIDSSDGRWKIRTRIYRPRGVTEKLPVLLYIHGGGYIACTPELFNRVIEQFIETRPCVVISPDYRKAYVEPFPAAFNDCYETLIWAKNNADKLGVRDDRFIIAGHSAGGGLTAAVTLKARDTGAVDIAFQMPIYPMIDDEQPHDAGREISVPVWDSDMNRIGWSAYLAALNEAGTDIPAYAAPARNTDYEGFPPSITFVGTLEPFYQETLDYVNALKEAGIEVAYKEYEGCFHAFDMFGQPISEDAQSFTYDQYADFYDRHVN